MLPPLVLQAVSAIKVPKALQPHNKLHIALIVQDFRVKSVANLYHEICVNNTNFAKSTTLDDLAIIVDARS